MDKPTSTNNRSTKPEQIMPTGVLTCEEIEKFGLINPINKTADENNSLQLTTYDLRLGEFHYVSSKKEWIPTYIGNKNDEIYEMIKNQETFYVGDTKLNMPGNELTIPPYGKALIQLLETVDTVNVAKKGFFVVGHFDLKLSKVQKGLISQQATQVEPYYKGKLFCYLFNLSKQEIKLKYADRIASIEFTYVSRAEYKNKKSWEKTTSEFYNSNLNKYTGKTGCGELGILNALYFAYNKQGAIGLPDGVGLNELYSDIEENTKQVEKLKQEIEIQISNCKTAKDDASNAAKEVRDFMLQNNQAKEQKKASKIALWVSVLITLLTAVLSIALQYGVLDVFFKKQDDSSPPTEEVVIYNYIDNSENKDVFYYEI